MANETYQWPWFYVGLVVLLIVLILSITLLIRVKRWLRQVESKSTDDSLAEFERLYLQGELSRDEIERIRSTYGTATRPVPPANDSAEMGIRKFPDLTPPQSGPDEGEFGIRTDPPSG